MESPRVEIHIKDHESCSFGKIRALQDNRVIFECHILGRPYLDNAPFISRIPNGDYEMVKRKATEHIPVEHLLIKDTPGRHGICIHPFNQVSESKGCFAPGLTYSQNLNEFFVWKSRSALNKLLYLLNDTSSVSIFS